MTRRTQTLLIAGVSWTALFSLAFVAAPHSCEWGSVAYLGAGVVNFVALFFIPMVLQTDHSVPKRAGLGLGFAFITLIVWAAGLVIANVRILCRLF